MSLLRYLFCLSFSPVNIFFHVYFIFSLKKHDSAGTPIPWITAVGFGTPPCVDEAIGDAMLEDNLMVSVVHCDDIVPRLSRRNIQSLAMEVNKYSVEAMKFQKEDQKILEDYAKNYGRTGDMGDDEDEDVKEVVVKEEEEVVTEAVVVSVQEEEEGGLQEQMKVLELEDPLVVPGKIVHLTFCNGKRREEREGRRKEEGGWSWLIHSLLGSSVPHVYYTVTIAIALF